MYLSFVVCLLLELIINLRVPIEQLHTVLHLDNKQHWWYWRNSFTVSCLTQKTVWLTDCVSLLVLHELLTWFGDHFDLAFCNEIEGFCDFALTVDWLIFVPLLSLSHQDQIPDKSSVGALFKHLDSVDQVTILVEHDLISQIRWQLFLEFLFILLAKVLIVIILQKLVDICKKLRVHFWGLVKLVKLFQLILEVFLVCWFWCDMGGDWTYQERVKVYTECHPNQAHDELWVGPGWIVPIADSDQSLNSPVHTVRVLPKRSIVNEAFPIDPSLWVEVIESWGQKPEATRNVDWEYCDHKRLDHSRKIGVDKVFAYKLGKYRFVF